MWKRLACNCVIYGWTSVLSVYSTPLPPFLVTEAFLSFGELPQPHLWGPYLPATGYASDPVGQLDSFWEHWLQGRKKRTPCLLQLLVIRTREATLPLCDKSTENKTHRSKVKQRDRNSARNNDDIIGNPVRSTPLDFPITLVNKFHWICY